MRIRELRLARGISGSELARACQVSPPSEFNWEIGKVLPSSDKLPVIAAALGCEVGDLYDAEELKRASDEAVARIHAKAVADAQRVIAEGSS